MTPAHIRLRFADGLLFFLAARHRRSGSVELPHDGTSTLGHAVQSLGVPLTEVGELTVHGPGEATGRAVGPGYRPREAETAYVPTAPRPQAVPAPGPPRFVLDVHLGALARRLRLVGLDAAYGNDASDDELLAQAGRERRVLLTQDRGLLLRRALWLGAYVRGARPDDQLLDVLDRFAPPLKPWTRCMACNGTLAPVAKSEIAPLLRPGTRRTYDSFMRCVSCSRVFWRGAHSGRLESLVDRAVGAAAETERGRGVTVGDAPADGGAATDRGAKANAPRLAGGSEPA
ncbi:Mut7-C RNAse domain-containing protein [Streptomyces winkii]|uniref:Mut7-C RNAse domain-containing protein n=1 Tax=Streptomyces winkii TaxID=3051178 RepID=UPI0028D21A72|nr:Mut7-C RNAse domain-containing protein [Streptomyces sp. DSM 40971]